VPGFTTPDPLAETHTWESQYAYCGGDPVNRMDPTGLEWYTNDGLYTFITGHDEEAMHLLSNMDKKENSMNSVTNCTGFENTCPDFSGSSHFIQTSAIH